MTTTNENLSGTVVVIGGGVVGCFLAYRLASEGVSVTLVEQEGPGAGATGNSAGNIQPGSGDDDTYKIALGAESLSIWRNQLPRIKETGKIDYLEQDVRYLYAATNDQEEQISRQILSDLNAAGLKAEWVDGPTARKIEPRLSDSIIGGAFHQDCIQMDPKLFMAALAHAAESEGVRILRRSPAVGLSISGDRVSSVALQDGNYLECSSVVLATGAWTPQVLSEWLGYNLPVVPHGLQKIHINLGSADPLNCAVRWNSVNIVCRRDGLVHAGSKFDPAGFDTKPTNDVRDWLLDQVGTIVPGLQPLGVETIAAFAASTPNRIPLVGQLPGTDGVYLAVPSTDGFLMSALLADMTTKLMVNGQIHQLIKKSPLAQAKPR